MYPHIRVPPTRTPSRHNIAYHVVGMEVFTEVAMKRFIFRDAMPCSLVKVNVRFGETCRSHLQARFMLP
jgi:hypothetical protein